MTDTAERAINEAEEWLASAKDKLALSESDEGAANVCCALAIHAIIRANDAVSLKSPILQTKSLMCILPRQNASDVQRASVQRGASHHV
jgi:hypothetical protein